MIVKLATWNRKPLVDLASRHLRQASNVACAAPQINNRSTQLETRLRLLSRSTTPTVSGRCLLATSSPLRQTTNDPTKPKSSSIIFQQPEKGMSEELKKVIENSSFVASESPQEGEKTSNAEDAQDTTTPKSGGIFTKLKENATKITLSIFAAGGLFVYTYLGLPEKDENNQPVSKISIDRFICLFDSI